MLTFSEREFKVKIRVLAPNELVETKRVDADLHGFDRLDRR